MRFAATGNNRLEAEFLGQIERPFDLTLRRCEHHDRLPAGNDVLQRIERRIELRTLHAARVLGVRGLLVAIVLRVEQHLTPRRKHPH